MSDQVESQDNGTKRHGRALIGVNPAAVAVALGEASPGKTGAFLGEQRAFPRRRRKTVHIRSV